MPTPVLPSDPGPSADEAGRGAVDRRGQSARPRQDRLQRSCRVLDRQRSPRLGALILFRATGHRRASGLGADMNTERPARSRAAQRNRDARRGNHRHGPEHSHSGQLPRREGGQALAAVVVRLHLLLHGNADDARINRRVVESADRNTDRGYHLRRCKDADRRNSPVGSRAGMDARRARGSAGPRRPAVRAEDAEGERLARLEDGQFKPR